MTPTRHAQLGEAAPCASAVSNAIDRNGTVLDFIDAPDGAFAMVVVQPVWAQSARRPPRISATQPHLEQDGSARVSAMTAMLVVIRYVDAHRYRALIQRKQTRRAGQRLGRSLSCTFQHLWSEPHNCAHRIPAIDVRPARPGGVRTQDACRRRTTCWFSAGSGQTVVCSPGYSKRPSCENGSSATASRSWGDLGQVPCSFIRLLKLVG